MMRSILEVPFCLNQHKSTFWFENRSQQFWILNHSRTEGSSITTMGFNTVTGLLRTVDGFLS
jgi:hypothetical protein